MSPDNISRDFLPGTVIHRHKTDDFSVSVRLSFPRNGLSQNVSDIAAVYLLSFLRLYSCRCIGKKALDAFYSAVFPKAETDSAPFVSVSANVKSCIISGSFTISRIFAGSVSRLQ